MIFSQVMTKMVNVAYHPSLIALLDSEIKF